VPSSMYKLTVRKGPQQGQAYPLVSSMVTVGRDPMADIVIADPEVSRQHARLTRTAEGYEIQDLGSTNGTFVDGQRLTGDPVRLQAGQAISMGTNVTLVFEAAADPMATVVSEPELEIPEPPAEEEQPPVEEEEPPPAPAEAPQPLPDTDPFEEDEGEEADADATALEFPTFKEEEEASFGEEGEPPSFDEPEIPEPAPYEPAPQEQTILDTEPEPPSYAYEEPEEEAGELPSFGAEEPAQGAPAQRPIAEAHDELPPPPPSPPETPAGDNRNRNIIIAVVVILLVLCCCCILAYGGWIYGDAIMQELGLY